MPTIYFCEFLRIFITMNIVLFFVLFQKHCDDHLELCFLFHYTQKCDLRWVSMCDNTLLLLYMLCLLFGTG